MLLLKAQKFARACGYNDTAEAGTSYWLVFWHVAARSTLVSFRLVYCLTCTTWHEKNKVVRICKVALHHSLEFII